MAQNAKCKDTQDVQFKLHDKFVAFKQCGELRSNVKLLAISSSRGLLFAGNPNAAEFKVIIIKDLADAKITAKQPQARLVSLPSVPIFMCCSGDGNQLAVNFSHNGTSLLHIYNVQSFMTPAINPIYNIRLAPEDYVHARQLLWNPVLPNSLAVVLSNGGLGMYVLKDGGKYEMFSLEKSNQVQCGCWSPKGKQIVLGFPNGKLQQFKPDLTPAKTIVCPPNVHDAPFDTIALHWLSTFQFAVVFLQHGEDCSPVLYIVNAPKAGVPSYTNFYDICYSLNGPRNHHFDFVHVPQWNLLLVTSDNGVEVGVMGTTESGDMPTWQQLALLDEARIELPLSEATQEETFPLGFSYDTSSTHQLTINEQKLPTMPMVHVLGTDGTLLVFNFINFMPGAASVCSPPPPAADSSGQFRPLNTLLAAPEKPTTIAAVPTPQEPTSNPAQTELSFAFTPNTVTSTPAPAKDKAPSLFAGFGAVASKSPTPAAATQLTFGASSNTAAPLQTFASPNTVPGFGGFGGTAATAASGSVFAAPTTASSSVFAAPAATSGSVFAAPAIGSGGVFAAATAGLPTTTGFGVAPSATDKPSLFAPAAVAAPPAVSKAVPEMTAAGTNKPLYTVPPTFSTAPPKAAPPAADSHPEYNENDVEDVINQIMAVQINAFSAEIQQLKQQTNAMLKNIENPATVKFYTKRLDDLQELNDQAKDIEFELDVQGLRQSLNEAYAMVAECRAKLEVYRNPDITRLMSATTFDPAGRRVLTRLQSYLAANEAQMCLAQQYIDTQWEQYQDVMRRSSKAKMHMPCLEGIYQRLTKLQNKVSDQRIVQNNIKSNLKERGLLQSALLDKDASRSRQSEAVDTLAESILSLNISQAVETNQAKLTQQKMQIIRRTTQKQKIQIIKPQRPDRVGLKSEVILETKRKAELKKQATAAAAAKPTTAHKSVQVETAAPLAKPTASKPTAAVSAADKPSMTVGSSLSGLFSFSNSSPFAKTTTASATTTTLSAAANVETAKPGAPLFGGLGSGTPFNFAQAAAANVNTAKPVLSFGGPTADINAQAPKPTAGAAAANASSIFSGFGSSLEAPKSVIPSELSKKADKIKDNTEAKPFGGETAAKSPQTPKAEAANKPFAFSGFANFAGTQPATPPQFSFTGMGATLDAAAAAPKNTPNVLVSSSSSSSSSSTVTTSSGSIFGAAGTGLFAANTKATTDVADSTPSFGTATIAKATSSSAVTTTATATATATPTATTTPAAAATAAAAPTRDAALNILSDIKICKPLVKDGGGDAATPNAPAVNVFGGIGTAGSSGGSFQFGMASSAGGDASRGFFANAATTAAAVTSTAATVTTTAAATSVVSTVSSTTSTTTTAAVTPSTGFSFSNAFSTLKTSTTPAASTAATAPAAATTAAFAAPVTTAASTTPTTSIFGSNVFGGAASATPIVSPFSAPPATVGTTTSTAATSNIFGSVPKPEPSAFGAATPMQAAPTPTGLFAAASLGSSPFSSPPAAAASTGNIFGQASSPAAGSIFGGAATAAASSPFGGSATTAASSPFGGSATTAASSPFGGSSIFGGPSANNAQSPTPTSGGSVFGQSVFGQTAPAATSGNIFGAAASPQPQSSAFGGSIFAAAANQTPAVGGSIFGGSSPGFGAFSQASPAGGAFGGGGGGGFAQGGASVAQTGFGSPQQSQQAAGGFGAKPVFGGSPSFGAPAFGASPTFGSTSFGSPKGFGTFGGNTSATATPAFGAAAPAPKGNIFDTLGNTDAGLSFGNLAQTGNNNAQKPAFGGSSFLNYR